MSDHSHSCKSFARGESAPDSARRRRYHASMSSAFLGLIDARDLTGFRREGDRCGAQKRGDYFWTELLLE